MTTGDKVRIKGSPFNKVGTIRHLSDKLPDEAYVIFGDKRNKYGSWIKIERLELVEEHQ